MTTSQDDDQAGTVLHDFSAIEDIPITLCAELDCRKIHFRELFNLGEGSVVAFPRPTGENVDLYVEEVRIGTGEILIVDSTLAVRVSDIRDRSGSEVPTDRTTEASK
jgi:flagellar motor switch protein FliN